MRGTRRKGKVWIKDRYATGSGPARTYGMGCFTSVGVPDSGGCQRSVGTAAGLWLKASRATGLWMPSLARMWEVGVCAVRQGVPAVRGRRSRTRRPPRAERLGAGPRSARRRALARTAVSRCSPIGDHHRWLTQSGPRVRVGRGSDSDADNAVHRQNQPQLRVAQGKDADQAGGRRWNGERACRSTVTGTDPVPLRHQCCAAASPRPAPGQRGSPSARAYPLCSGVVAPVAPMALRGTSGAALFSPSARGRRPCGWCRRPG